jgi:hypothetical protein
MGELQVHHRHYKTLGREQPEDVEVLCPACHRVADAEREKRSKEIRIDTFATKKYGPHWREWRQLERMEAGFSVWLATKEKP